MAKLTFLALIVLCVVCLVLFAATTMTNGGVVFKTFATHPDTPPAGGLLVWAKTDGTMQTTNSSGTDAGMGGGATGGYDPADVTVFSNTVQLTGVAFASGSGGSLWGFTASCSASLLVASARTITPTRGGMISLVQATAPAASGCQFFAPWSPGGGAIIAFTDFITGSTPLVHKLKIYAQRDTTASNGTFEIGWGKAATNYTDTAGGFVGIRDDGTNYRCLISGPSNAIVAAVNIVALDTAEHWFTVDNGAGAANSITCKVGSTSATVAGTIPANAQWSSVIGLNTPGASAGKYNAGEARVYIGGRQGF